MDQDQRRGASDAPGVPDEATAPAAGPVSERIRALLSQAAQDPVGDDPLREPRAVPAVLTERLDVLSRRLEEVAAAVTASSAGSVDVALHVSALSADVDRVVTAVEDLSGVVRTELDGLRRLIEQLGLRLDALEVRTPVQVSGAVLADVADQVHAATADSERRVLAHVDEAVLALAETLLRRRAGRADAESHAPVPPAAASSTEMAFPDVAPPVVDHAGPAGAVDEDGEALPGEPQRPAVPGGVVAPGGLAPRAGRPEPAGADGTGLAEAGLHDEPVRTGEPAAGPHRAAAGDRAGAGQEDEALGDGALSAAVEDAPTRPHGGAEVVPGAAPAQLAPAVAALAEPVSPTAGGDDPAVAASSPHDTDVRRPLRRPGRPDTMVTEALAPVPRHGSRPVDREPEPPEPAPAPAEEGGRRRPWWRPGG